MDEPIKWDGSGLFYVSIVYKNGEDTIEVVINPEEAVLILDKDEYEECSGDYTEIPNNVRDDIMKIAKQFGWSPVIENTTSKQ